jgi:hypothetical protein
VCKQVGGSWGAGLPPRWQLRGTQQHLVEGTSLLQLVRTLHAFEVCVATRAPQELPCTMRVASAAGWDAARRALLCLLHDRALLLSQCSALGVDAGAPVLSI